AGTDGQLGNQLAARLELANRTDALVVEGERGTVERERRRAGNRPGRIHDRIMTPRRAFETSLYYKGGMHLKGNRVRVEILCTGDEILTGKTVNTNYSHMARRLGEVGLDVTWGTTVGDDRAS